jgi:phosphatidylglycerol:prolipoprotein diacylglycerol transferase
MKPEFISYPVHISSYPVLLLTGFFFGYLLARKRASRAAIPGRHIDNIVLLLVIAGPFGARLFSRLFEMHLGIWEALKVLNGGGLVFYGGFIVSILTVMVYALIARLPLVKLCDVAAPSAALGLAFGRIGCFMAGCCWGDVCVDSARIAQITNPAAAYQVWTVPILSGPGIPFAVTFPRDSDVYQQHAKLGLIGSDASRSLPVHPAQLYESAMAFILCGLLARKKSMRPGQISLGLLLGYAVIRFSVEFLRADNSPVYWGMTLSQVISILMAAVCSLLILARKSGQGRATLPVLAASS